MATQATSRRRGPKPKLDTRDNLIRAGLKVLHEAGYAATGIQDIVNLAEVPKGSFYNHFPSKEAFGQAVVEHYFASGLDDLQRLLVDPATPPLDRLRNYFDERIRTFRDMGFERGCLMGNFSLEIADHSALIRDSIAAQFQNWSRMIETCVAEAQASGAIANAMPAPLLANFVLNSWEGALVRMRSERSDRPLTDFQQVVFGALLA